MPYAGFGWRLLAMLVDSLLLIAVGCFIGLFIGITMGIFFAFLGLDPATIQALASLVSNGFGVLTGWLYFAIMEASPWQATLGKRLFNIRVTNLDGERITFLRATGRFFAKYISALICLIGYFMAAFTERRQGLHDMLAGTLVLRDEDGAPPPAQPAQGQIIR
jgi:uncharacterized RDD family membrane protein YckC